MPSEVYFKAGSKQQSAIKTIFRGSSISHCCDNRFNKGSIMKKSIEEIIGGIILAFPDNGDEVACLKIQELFNDVEIFEYDGNEWSFDIMLEKS